VTNRPLFSYIDALVAGRRPGSFKASPEDVEVLRAAIELRAARPGDAIPDEEFVAYLYHSLAEQSNAESRENVRAIGVRRVRAALIAVAASVALIGGTFVATKSLSPTSATTAAQGVPEKSTVRTGTFETTNGEVLGQIVAYDGHPSWIYLNVGVSQLTGNIICRLQLKNGSIVAAGVIETNKGTGELSKSVPVAIDRLRGAKLFTPSGTELATATFA